MHKVSDKSAMSILRSLRDVDKSYLDRAEDAFKTVGIVEPDKARFFADPGFQPGSREINALCFCVNHVFVAYMGTREHTKAKKFSNYVYRELFELSEDRAINMAAITSMQMILSYCEGEDYPRQVIRGVLKNIVRCLDTHDESIFDYANSTISQIEGE